MRILFAGDEHHYSAYALKKVLGLARNTWADVTLLAVYPTASGKELGMAAPWSSEQPLHEALDGYRKEFLQGWEGEECPYALQSQSYEWVLLKSRVGKNWQ